MHTWFPNCCFGLDPALFFQISRIQLQRSISLKFETAIVDQTFCIQRDLSVYRYKLIFQSATVQICDELVIESRHCSTNSLLFTYSHQYLRGIPHISCKYGFCIVDLNQLNFELTFIEWYLIIHGSSKIHQSESPLTDGVSIWDQQSNTRSLPLFDRFFFELAVSTSTPCFDRRGIPWRFHRASPRRIYGYTSGHVRYGLVAYFQLNLQQRSRCRTVFVMVIKIFTGSHSKYLRMFLQK
jgi:hypothetical protein